MGAEKCKKYVFEGLAKQVVCELGFLSLLRSILDCFLTYFEFFLMLFGGGRNVHVDNGTLVKIIFFMLSPPKYELYPSDDFWKLAHFFLRKS